MARDCFNIPKSIEYLNGKLCPEKIRTSNFVLRISKFWPKNKGFRSITIKKFI
jgi:hypothetical protein